MADPDAPPSTSPDGLPPTPTPEQLTYSSYLKVEELLALQQPLSNPQHPDELLFILIHQVYELWFKQLLHELDLAVAAFDEDRVLVGHKIFRRVLAIQRVMVEQIGVLETMTPQDFALFRERLNPASGFQSAQFREAEYLMGLKDRRFLRFHERTPAIHARLERRLEEPSLYDAFCGGLARAGFDVAPHAPTDSADQGPESLRLVAALKRIYDESEDHYALYLACEYLIEADELLQVWRFRHVKMVQRTIGMKRGTGGSAGAKYLERTLSKRCFPELWDVRSHLGLLPQGGAAAQR